MVDVWLKRRCLNSGCTRHVFYLTQWRTPPIYCNHCRLSEIDDLRSLLVNYLDIEPKIRSLRKECGRLEDEQLSILRDRLLIKVRDLLKKCGYNFGYLVELCEQDKEITRLAFRLAKDKQFMNRPIRRRSNVKNISKNISQFLQGGSPGLGKRS